MMMTKWRIASASLATVVLSALPGAHAVPARPGAFSTLLPMPRSETPAIAAPSLMVRHDAIGISRYEPAPMPVAMHAPPERWTTAGQILCMLRSISGGCHPHPGDDPRIPLANDPMTGSAIGTFGPAYRDASPVGHGLASSEAMTVGAR